MSDRGRRGVARRARVEPGAPAAMFDGIANTADMAGEGALVDYTSLAEFRFLLRGFVEFSETAARGAGLTPRQHQALLQIKGFPTGQMVTVGSLAARLHIRHHSAVELVDRLEQAGLIERSADRADRRRVMLRLTAKSEALLSRLARAHHEELRRLGPALSGLLEKFSPPQTAEAAAGA